MYIYIYCCVSVVHQSFGKPDVESNRITLSVNQTFLFLLACIRQSTVEICNTTHCTRRILSKTTSLQTIIVLLRVYNRLHTRIAWKPNVFFPRCR